MLSKKFYKDNLPRMTELPVFLLSREEVQAEIITGEKEIVELKTKLLLVRERYVTIFKDRLAEVKYRLGSLKAREKTLSGY